MLETIGLFLTFVWPGLLAVNVYRLIVPGPRIEWKDAVTQGLFHVHPHQVHLHFEPRNARVNRHINSDDDKPGNFNFSKSGFIMDKISQEDKARTKPPIAILILV